MYEWFLHRHDAWDPCVSEFNLSSCWDLDDTGDHCYLPRNTINEMKLLEVFKRFRLQHQVPQVPTDQWMLSCVSHVRRTRPDDLQQLKARRLRGQTIQMSNYKTKEQFTYIMPWYSRCFVIMSVWDLWEPAMAWRRETLAHESHGRL